MADRFYLLDEPLLEFCGGMKADDPRDGLSLYGAYGSSEHGIAPVGPHVVIGTAEGIKLWHGWVEAMNTPAACVDPRRHRPWPPYPGFDVAFGSPCPRPVMAVEIDSAGLSRAARRTDRHDRAHSVASLYLASIDAVKKLDEHPSMLVCVVPDLVHQNCRPKSVVLDTSDEAPDRMLVGLAKEEARTGQASFLGNEAFVGKAIESPEKYQLSPDFRRQLKARMMPHGIPIQIVREGTLQITPQIRDGHKGTNPLSDRLWNLGTTLYYKSGRKPWKLAGARDGVCYVGLAYRQTEGGRTACCAAQMFLDSGDGIVFLGDFGPWYSEEKREFHLSARAAEGLLRGTIRTYEEQGGRALREVFLHAQSGLDDEEFRGFLKACPVGCKLVGVRVRPNRNGLRLFRAGTRPVIRGTFWQRTERFGLLFSNGFKPRLGTYDGFEVPVPLDISIQHGDADVVSVARDILALTKLNYNACQHGEGLPITIKFSRAVGEILLANPGLQRSSYRHNFKFYI